jgi:hypothetical protein
MLHLVPRSPAPVRILVGPVLYRDHRYSFDMYRAGAVHRSFAYRTVEEAIYDRKVTLHGNYSVACNTSDDFAARCALATPEPELQKAA